MHQTVVIRLPLIPGYNDSEANIKATAEFISGLEIVRLDIVPFHQLGSNKYQRLGRVYQLTGVKPYQEEEIQAFENTFESYGLEVSIA